MDKYREEIPLRPVAGAAIKKLSWEETAKAMAATSEDWSGWDVAVADGLAEIPWEEE